MSSLGVDLSIDVLQWFSERGENLTHLKLQKLLYYIESWHLVHMKDTLVNEEFEAWVHGPVLRSVYNQYSEFGYNPIVLDSYESDFSIPTDSIELVENVLEQYGAFSAFQLELLTHSETPWIKARNGLGPLDYSNSKIDQGSIIEYYSSKLRNE